MTGPSRAYRPEGAAGICTGQAKECREEEQVQEPVHVYAGVLQTDQAVLME